MAVRADSTRLERDGLHDQDSESASTKRGTSRSGTLRWAVHGGGGVWSFNERTKTCTPYRTESQSNMNVALYGVSGFEGGGR